ncbi:MAG: hypothetical protein AB1420_01555 [Bacillota bacterium]
MKRCNLEEIWQKLNCLLPVYDENGGNITELHLEDGSVKTDQRRMASVLKALAKLFAVDIEAARKNYSRLVGRKNSMPIPLHRDLVLVPVKARKPLGREDGAWGYLVMAKVLAYEKHPEIENATRVVFESGQSLDVLQLPQSVKAIMDDAKMIRNAYTRLHLVAADWDDDMLKEAACFYVLVPYTQKGKIKGFVGDTSPVLTNLKYG